MSVQQKLARVFPESFQVKRVSKEFNDVKELREKGSYDIRTSMIRGECLNFWITLLPPAFKNTSINPNIKQEVKIVVRSNYPADPPGLYFMNDSMIGFKFWPFRNYMNQMLGSEQWSAKHTIMQIVKSLPEFIEKQSKLKASEINVPMPMFREYFQIDTIFSWKFCQVHPVRLLKGNNTKQGYLVINTIRGDVVILDETTLETSVSTCDYFRGNQLASVRKNKTSPQRILLEVKIKYPGMSGSFAIQLYAQDYDNLIFNLMDCAKSQKAQQQKDQSSSEEEEQAETNPKPESSQDINISEIHESIVVYESLVDNKMTSQNVSQLVLLLKKAIQYYSALSDNRFKIYLEKLQNILSNQMAQVLLESETQAEVQKKGHKQLKYQSILDLI